MAEIKLRKSDHSVIKTLDRAAISAHRIKDVTIRTKAELEREDRENAADYAGKVARDNTAAVYIGAKKVAVDAAVKRRENAKYTEDEQDIMLSSFNETNNLAAAETELADLSGSMSQNGTPTERIGAFNSLKAAESHSEGSVIQAQMNSYHDQSVIQTRINTRERVASRKSRLRRAADIKSAGINMYRPKGGDPAQARTYETGNSADRRMKELAIRQIRGEPRNRFAARGLSIPFSMRQKNAGKTRTTSNLIRHIAEGAHANTSALSIAGAVTIMIIVITIMFSATFSMTGGEDGNDFAYDFYGFGTGDIAIVEVARAQLGNVGGDKFWKWYGFNGHVHWCACFVSWCADQCGYTRAGIIPKYAVCADGASWFKTHHRWASRGYAPKAGDIIFYDYDSDGHMDHTGIVEACDGRTITTIEGNVSNVCRRQTHPVGSNQIAGFGVPVFRPSAGFDNACAWAARIAADGSYHYVNWQSGNSLTHECPVCHNHPAGNYRGWNCIGFAFACWRHGAGIRCRCSCSVVNDPNWEKLLHCSSDAEASKLATRLVGVPCTVIRNGGNAIPINELRKGDILGLFNGSTYFHTIFYEGGGKYADCTSGRSDNIQASNTLPDSTKGKIKVAIRYIG